MDPFIWLWGYDFVSNYSLLWSIMAKLVGIGVSNVGMPRYWTLRIPLSCGFFRDVTTASWVWNQFEALTWRVGCYIWVLRPPLQSSLWNISPCSSKSATHAGYDWFKVLSTPQFTIEWIITYNPLDIQFFMDNPLDNHIWFWNSGYNNHI